MTKKTENRGRKPKQVDAEMFHQLVCYFQEKPLINVTQNEKLLAEFMHQFSDSSLHFESIQEQYKKVQIDNPRLSHQEVVDKLISDNYKIYYAMLADSSPKLELFEKLRSDEKKRIHLKSQFFSYYNVDDIDQSNRYFQALKKEDAGKLMQRLRKIKFQKSQRFGEKKVGIDIDQMAYQQLKSFSDEYGFKTLSIGISVMSAMAKSHHEHDVIKALESLYYIGLLKPGEVFISNTVTKRIEDWLNDGLIYYSKESYKYYLSSHTFADSADEGCYEIDFNGSDIMRQMRRTNRVFLGESVFTSPIIGQFINGAVNEDATKDEYVRLSNVNSPQRLLGGSDTFKSFRAVEVLFLKWELIEQQKVDLLGFNPRTMNIDDQDQVQMRLSLLLNIHEQLRTLFDNTSNIYGYMTSMNYNEPYKGKRPIVVACESLEGLKLVYNSLSSIGS